MWCSSVHAIKTRTSRSLTERDHDCFDMGLTDDRGTFGHAGDPERAEQTGAYSDLTHFNGPVYMATCVCAQLLSVSDSVSLTAYALKLCK